MKTIYSPGTSGLAQSFDTKRENISKLSNLKVLKNVDAPRCEHNQY